MRSYRLSHLADHVLLRELDALASKDCVTTADLLAHIAEVDERRLYRQAGYPSMYAYCVHKLRMSEDVAYKRIQAARAARAFPAILPAVADGRLHLTGVVRIAPHLTPLNAAELLAAAEHKTRAEIELLLAERFPQPDVPTLLSPVGPSAAQLVPEPVGVLAASTLPAAQLVPEPVGESPVARQPVAAPARPRVTPLSPGRFALQVTVDQETQEQLRYAQALLGRAVPAGDVAEVLKRALNSLVRELEKKKFGSRVLTRPRRGNANPRHVPVSIRRTVWQRDGGRCTFVSASGRRCEENADLEFDHIDPLARGGRTVASNLRLCCRGHNQYEAERTFGSDFMRGKREQAKRRTLEAKANAEAQAKASAEADARATAEARARSEATAQAVADVIPVLRHLGFKAEEARRGAEHCAHLAGAPLEQRLRVALQSLAPPCRREPAPMAAGAS